MHRESNLITVQQDATYSVYYISVGSSTCFGCCYIFNILLYVFKNTTFNHPPLFYIPYSSRLVTFPPPPRDGTTARGGPWPPLQYSSRSLGSLLYLSIRLYPSFSGPWTRHPAISFLVFLFVLLHTAFLSASFLGLRCLAFFLYAQVILFFDI